MSASKRIAHLILRYMYGGLPRAQQQELNAWINANEKNKQVFIDLTSTENKIQAETQAKAKKAVLKKILLQNPELKPIRRISNFYMLAAASVIAIMLLTGGYFMLKHKPAAPNEGFAATGTIETLNDIGPGQDRALLTLSNGETITLDSAQNGTLAKQDGAVVRKAGAVLQYASTDKTTSHNTYNTLSTPRGGKYKLVLPDGSMVWLNAASSITYPTAFAGNQRNVSITGEAYFEVAKDATKPFIVDVNKKASIEVLGTHFNANAYTNEADIKTTLLEGKVKISDGKSSGVLKPGQQAQVGNTGNVKIVDNANVEEVMAWKNGLMSFTGVDIKTIMRQVERWYAVDVEYKGNINVPMLTGKIPRDIQLSQLLNALELNSGLHFTIQANKVLVSK